MGGAAPPASDSSHRRRHTRQPTKGHMSSKERPTKAGESQGRRRQCGAENRAAGGGGGSDREKGGRWRHQQLAAPSAPAPDCWTGAQELRGASNQASRGPEPEQTALQAAGCAGRGRGKESGVDARELGGGACAPRLGTQGQSRNQRCLRVGGRGARGAQWFRVAARMPCWRLQPYRRAWRGSSAAVCRWELPEEASREAETGAHGGQDRKEGPTGGKERVE